MNLLFAELLEFVRARSPFYRDLYSHLPRAGVHIEDLPVLDQSEFWRANSSIGSNASNRVLTGEIADGVIYKSGGTTGSPKFSVFTRDEWRAFTHAFGWGMNQGGLKRGERVANLFYSGELYASFLFIGASIESAPEPALCLPISGSAPFSETASILRELGADVLAGVPTSLLAFASHIEQSGLSIPSIRKVLFGGESMYPDQREYLQKIFPGIEIRSIGYASVDAGLLGYADLDCGPGEHRCFSQDTILELVDDDGRAIRGQGEPGRLVITNLNRRLMPVIRYPAGDRAEWVEAEGTTNRKFKLLGRAEEGARIGPATLYYEDIARVLEPFAHDLSLQGFQLVLDHSNMKDRLVLRAAVQNLEAAQSQTSAVLAHLLGSRPMVAKLIEQGRIHQPHLDWIRPSELAVNRRTGKVLRVIDQRGNESRKA